MKHIKFEAILNQLPLELRKKITELSFDSVDEAAKRFVHSVGLRFKSGAWLNEYQLPQMLLEGDVSNFTMHDPLHDTTHFFPFAEKIQVEQGSKICIIGDVHGDLGYLVAVLTQLMQKGYLDKDYRLVDPTVYICFVGDYTNRNHHGVEVMLTLFYLYRHNLGRIFLLRGNHEYAISVRVVYEMFQAGLREQHHDSSHNSKGLNDAFISEMSRKFSPYQFPDLLYWFDFLPMSLYIGSYDDTTHSFNYINVCHGGIEPGYSATSLLESDARYERFKFLNRYESLQNLIKENVIADSAHRLDFIFKALTKRGLDEYARSFTSPDSIVSLEQRHNPRQLRLGMQWNSFLTQDNDQIAIASSFNHRNILFGNVLTQYFLAQSRTPAHRVVSIIRGHQHLDDVDEEMGLNSPMLTQLREQNGIVRQWNGSVYTMGDGGSATGWQAFMIVETSNTLSAWKTTHYFRADSENPFEQNSMPFLSKK